MDRNVKIAMISIGLALVWAVFPMPARAEENVYADPAVQRKVAEWKRLKAEDPERFEALVRERKRNLKARLMELKRTDPQKFEEVKQRIIYNRRAHLQRLRSQDPEKFRQIMQRKAWQLEELRRKDPARFEQIIRSHPRLAARYKKGNGARRPGHDRAGPWERGVRSQSDDEF
jgi:hypothetical protein